MRREGDYARHHLPPLLVPVTGRRPDGPLRRHQLYIEPSLDDQLMTLYIERCRDAVREGYAPPSVNRFLCSVLASWLDLTDEAL